MNPSGGDAPLQPAGLHCEAKAVRNITSVPAIQNCAKVSPSTTLLWVMTPSGILPRRNRDSSAARSPSFPGEISLLSFTDLLTTPRSFLSVKIPPIEICWSLADRYGWRMNGVNLDKSKQILDCWPHNGIPGGSGWSGLSQLCPSSIYKQLLLRFSNTPAVPSWWP